MAICGLSKSWREENAEEVKKYGHLLNSKITTKPDISTFLAKYPMTDNHTDHKGGKDRDGSSGDASKEGGEYPAGKAGSTRLNDRRRYFRGV